MNKSSRAVAAAVIGSSLAGCAAGGPHYGPAPTQAIQQARSQQYWANMSASSPPAPNAGLITPKLPQITNSQVRAYWQNCSSGRGAVLC